MRIEKKYSRMHELNQKEIYTIADLLKYDLKNFTPVLLIEWQNVIYYDDVILKGTKYEFKYSNPTYWLNLNNGRFKYHKNNLNKLTQNNLKSIKNVISNLIQEKADFLNTKTYQINPLHILLKREVSTSEKNRRFCIVTGLNISMQKEDSFLLSHTGLKYYYKTDKKIFKEVESRYLSTLWIDADYTTKIKEIAHNIRNKINNQRLKQNRLYPQHQTQLFDISL